MPGTQYSIRPFTIRMKNPSVSRINGAPRISSTGPNECIQDSKKQRRADQAPLS